MEVVNTQGQGSVLTVTLETLVVLVLPEAHLHAELRFVHHGVHGDLGKDVHRHAVVDEEFVFVLVITECSVKKDVLVIYHKERIATHRNVRDSANGRAGQLVQCLALVEFNHETEFVIHQTEIALGLPAKREVVTSRLARIGLHGVDMVVAAQHAVVASEHTAGLVLEVNLV